MIWIVCGIIALIWVLIGHFVRRSNTNRFCSGTLFIWPLCLGCHLCEEEEGYEYPDIRDDPLTYIGRINDVRQIRPVGRPIGVRYRPPRRKVQRVHWRREGF